MSEIMIVMMVVMLVAIFGSDHKGMMSGHSGVDNTDQTRSCDQSGQTGCLPKSGQPEPIELSELGKSRTTP